MKADLSHVAGFPMALDSRTGEIVTDGLVRFGRVGRRAADLASVLFESDGLAPETEVYWNLPLREAGPATAVLEKTGLTYSCVLLPPLRIGREYVKTQGHYHPVMPGSDIPYPEVYTHLWGEPLLLLQRRSGDEADRIDDCVLIELQDGASVTIPPGYAHILINPADHPAVVAGLYSTAFSPIYEPISRLGGAAYYLIDEAGECAIANRRYAVRPPLRRLRDLRKTPFAPPDRARPLWTSFLADANRYLFLSDAEAARRRFPEEPQ